MQSGRRQIVEGGRLSRSRRHDAAVAEAGRVLERIQGPLAGASAFDQRDVIIYSLLAFADREQCGEWKPHRHGGSLSMPTPEQLEAAGQLARAALAACAKTGFPMPEVQIAIAIFESGWLTHAPGFNCCGTKHHHDVPWQLIGTHEWFTPREAAQFLAGDPRRKCELVQPVETQAGGRERYFAQDVFCAFASYEACFIDQAQYFLMAGPTGGEAWSSYLRTKDRASYVRAIAPHYSTTEGYATMILTEASSETVERALEAARSAAAPKEVS